MDEASDDDETHGLRGNGVGHETTAGPSGREAMLDAESNALRRAHETAGMREGYEAGKEETVQEGFDQGFRLASTAGFAWGEALGMAAMLDVACVVSKDEVKECVCDELWEEHGELKDRFPEKRTKKELAISLAELRKKLKFSTCDERGERGDRLHQVQD